MKYFLSLTILLLGLCSLQASPIIPKPQKIILAKGSFSLSAKTKIGYGKGAKGKAKQLAAYLKEDLKLSLRVVSAKKAGSNSIRFKLDSSLKHMGPEAYKMKITSRGIRISAPEKAGLFYAIQTIRQFLPLKGKKVKIPAQTIEDSPRFPWRGIMLDVSRQFMDADYVKRYLDMMPMHKLNTFHWHLIDDSGWRLEIKKYPKLTKIGAWTSHKGKPHGGFYTQKEIKEIVKYAADRHIDVVPEIEIPAHTLAALVAYPHLGCTGKQHRVPNRHHISREIYCAGRDSTYEFIEDIMKEVFALFPAKYIHVGGDEVHFDRWKKCEHCQAKIKKENLKNEKELQGYITRFFEKLCHKQNRRIIGWNEILTCNVSTTAGLMIWNRPQHAVTGARKGHPIVSAQVRHTYFDTPESKLPGEIVGAGWTPPVSLSNSYNWDPVPHGLTEDEAKNVLGGHGCLWTDLFLHKHWLRDRDKDDNRSEVYVDTLTLPRMAGLAEAVWTPKADLDFDNFQDRMKRQYRRYEKKGYHYRLPLPTVKIMRSDKGFKVLAQASIEGGKVHYTTDGSKPTADSPVFKKTVKIVKEKDFKAIVVNHDGSRQSLVFESIESDPRFAKYGDKFGAWKSGQVAARKAGAKTWEVTGLINKNAKYEVTFVYTGGGMRLDIDWIEILKNDRLIKRIKRHGFTGGRSKGNAYQFQIKEYETGASFKVRAGIYGDRGNNSNGLIFIKKI